MPGRASWPPPGVWVSTRRTSRGDGAGAGTVDTAKPAARRVAEAAPCRSLTTSGTRTSSGVVGRVGTGTSVLDATGLGVAGAAVSNGVAVAAVVVSAVAAGTFGGSSNVRGGSDDGSDDVAAGGRARGRVPPSTRSPTSHVRPKVASSVEDQRAGKPEPGRGRVLVPAVHARTGRLDRRPRGRAGHHRRIAGLGGAEHVKIIHGLQLQPRTGPGSPRATRTTEMIAGI